LVSAAHGRGHRPIARELAVPQGLQTSGRVAGFLHHRGFPIPSPAALGKIGEGFRQAMGRYAEANGIPWIRFGKGDRKIDVIRPYLQAAEREGRPGVVAIGVAQEFQWAWDATCKDTANGIPPRGEICGSTPQTA